MSQTVRIGLQLTSNDPFWVQVRDAIYQRCQQLGVNLAPLELDMTLLSGEEQVALVEELLAQELDAVIAQNIALHLIRTILDAGVPVVSITEIELQHPLVTTPHGLFDIAQMLAEFLAEQIGGRGRVLLAGGHMEGSDSGRSRIEGSLDVFGRYPDIAVTLAPTPWQSESAFDSLHAVMEGCDAAWDGILGLSDSVALAARDVSRELGLLHDNTVVVGINGDPLALAAILQGEMTATVETPASLFGCQAVDLACQAARGQPLPPRFSYHPRLVTRDNVADVAAEKLVAIADLPTRLVGISRHQEQQQLTQLQTSLEISQRVGSILERQQLRHEIADLIRSNYGYDHVQIFLWSNQTREFILDTPGEADANRIRIPLADSGLLGYTLLRNRPTFIPDMHHSQRFPPDPYWPATRSRVILPIRQGNQMLGLLDLHSQRPTQHTYQDLVGLQVLGDQLGITMRNVQLYSEAVAAHARAERASQLKSRLLANVSHALRTPLNVILGYSQSALATPNPYGVDLSPALLQDLRHIYASSQHLARLINDLLDLSRAEIDALDIFPETIHTRDFLAEVFQSMAGSMADGGEVEWRLELPADLPELQADPLRLRQVLLNLLSNAHKFTQRGHITLGAQVDPPYLHIWVEDTGCGIAPERQRHIFEAFTPSEQPWQAGQGVGLGLRVTHELVKLHQGMIWLDSTPGMGSTFHIQLPLAAAASSLPRTSPAGTEEGDSVGLSAPPPEPPPHASHLTRQMVTFIREHFDQPLTRCQLADHLGVSANYVTRVFRREMGLPPWQYLTRYRIAHARHLLRTTTYSITEIAGRVGYNDAAYFSRVFRKETGQSPLAFRKNRG